MNRRRAFVGLVALPIATLRAAETRPTKRQSGNLSTDGPPKAITLRPSGAVNSVADGQVIENLDLLARSGHGVIVRHSSVTIRNCRIRHREAGHGLYAEGVDRLVLQDLEIERIGAPASGAQSDDESNNIHLESCPGALITRVRASRGSSNIYAERSKGIRMRLLELYDARGPFPRGQNVQFNRSPGSILEDFSAENSPASWTEDNVSVFRSDRCIVRRGIVAYNNSPTGDGVMLEGSFDCLVEDVDATQQGNGAFAAVPEGDAGSGGCIFRRCRTRDSYNTPRDGREAPSSDGLSFYTVVSPGAKRHAIASCHYDALADPANLIWDVRSVNDGWSFTQQTFLPRPPVRLVFAWS